MNLFDARGRKFEVVNEVEVPEFKGDGGILAFGRADVKIILNDIYEMSFALHVKPPAWLYLDGRPCVPKILYNTFGTDEGYWYGFYFEKIYYTVKNVNDDIVPVRTMNAKVAKCLLI